MRLTIIWLVKKMPSVQEMVERLQKKRAELLKEAARLESAIEALRNTAYLFGEDINAASAMVEDEFNIDVNKDVNSRSATVLQPEDIARLARQTLIENGRPAKRGALVRLMEGKGIPLTGVDKAKNLGTILWRFNNKFVNIEGFGYWPRDLKFSNVYNPENPPDGIKFDASNGH